MKTLSLKILIFFLLISGPKLFGQTLTTVTLEGNVSDRIDQFGKDDLLQVESKEYTVKEAINLSDNNSIDSTNLQYREYAVIEKKVQLDPKRVYEIYPEAVSVGENGELFINYNSLVSILVKTISEQHEVIEQLNLRLTKIEKQFIR